MITLLMILILIWYAVYHIIWIKTILRVKRMYNIAYNTKVIVKSDNYWFFGDPLVDNCLVYNSKTKCFIYRDTVLLNNFLFMISLPYVSYFYWKMRNMEFKGEIYTAEEWFIKKNSI